MAETIISPGVFTRENDQSYLAQGISQIGAAIIGPTAQGPAFVPTLVENYNDFTRIFGEADGTSYVPYTVKSYLKSAGRATIVRVLPIAGYSSSVATAIVNYTSASVAKHDAVFILAPATAASQSAASTIAINNWNTSSMSFDVSASMTGPFYSGVSINSTAANYVENIFGTSPLGSKQLYVYASFKDTQATLVSAYSGAMYTSSISSSQSNAQGIDLHGTATAPAYCSPFTTITSQTINGSKLELFHVIANGFSSTKVAISIENIKPYTEMPAGVNYGTFTLAVRDISNVATALETFSNLTFDPKSPNYIARVIGDQYQKYETDATGNSKLNTYGDYPTRSKYIRVAILADIPAKAIPLGFKAYVSPIATTQQIAAPTTITTQYDTSISSFVNSNYMGFNFDADNNAFINLPIYMSQDTSTGIVSTSRNASFSTAFNLEDCKMPNTSNDAKVNFDITLTYDWAKKARKFLVALQGGFDGFNPLTSKNMSTGITTNAANTMGFTTTATGDGAIAYKKAIDTVSNADDFDINMLVLPGITDKCAGSIISYANQMCEARQDVFFLFDAVTANESVSDVVEQVSTKDSNYSATYYPWVKIYDSANDQYLWAPPSVVMAGVIAYNDRVAAEWWAPAGLNRGGIPEATQVKTRLTQGERDTLYEGRVNPIASFVGQGIVAWGQKTLQYKASALDRINVRRLLIALKKYIASTTKYLVFEQNTVATRQRFLNIVNPYLESVQQRQGLYAFKVVMDETNNTPDVIDRNMMAGAIYLQPVKTAEMIVIDFNILSTGAAFSA